LRFEQLTNKCKCFNETHYYIFKKFSIAAISLCFAGLVPPLAQGDIMVYPAKGQSNKQLSNDRYECHIWAVKQSGFDPSNAQAN
jgi:hypothetical protein